ncbi:MAG: DUF1592 domain-containing protein [Rhodospirillaceae bacterium]|nr:DUF1592 domain-containing protein [Rhodospirillaceae bacterium]
MTPHRILHRCAIVAVVGLGLAACEDPAPPIPGYEPSFRVLTESQYRNTIADVFGAQIVVGGSFDPLVRTNGLLAVGATSAHVTPSGLEQFDRRARSIAAQVIDDTNRRILIPCTPASETAADDACATQFFSQVGRLLYRRAVTPDEVTIPVAVAHAAAKDLGSFYEGIAAGLHGMLVSPAFLFAIDVTEPDPAAAGKPRLDGFTKASRLSFFLWNSSPDEPLLAAAEKGELHDPKGLTRQVERMLASPKLEAGMRAFFNDMLAFDDFAKIEKDTIIYPAFSAAVAESAREQTLRTIIDVAIAGEGDYRDLFTTRKTVMNGPLGRIYQVPVERPDGGWMPYEFPETGPRAGIVSHVSFAALYSHPGRSSPTLRGRAIRESLLCQKVPDPPGDVDFSLFNDPNSPNKTARERLTAHSTVATCAGCHKLTDPIGLALEKIDGAGQMRTTENGAPIDTAGDLDGVPYADAAGLGRAMRDNPAAPSCLVNRMYSYASGQAPTKAERDYLAFLEKSFASDGYRIPRLLRKIALSDALFAVSDQPVRSAGVASSKDDKS